jgi:hypothetical protein
MLGLAITLTFLIYLLRGFVSKKVLAFVLLSLTFAGSLTFGILVEKYHRFATAWELIIGLAGILWLCFAYYSFFFSFKIRQREDFLLLPSLSFLSVLLIGSVFTGFWDAMLPWILLMFRLVERHGEGL